MNLLRPAPIFCAPMDASKLGALAVVADVKRTLPELAKALSDVGYKGTQDQYRKRLSELKAQWDSRVNHGYQCILGLQSWSRTLRPRTQRRSLGKTASTWKNSCSQKPNGVNWRRNLRGPERFKTRAARVSQSQNIKRY
jgi:hypothetical protein